MCDVQGHGQDIAAPAPNVNTLVIPGRANGPSPESMTINRNDTETAVAMDSGLAAARRPGMTVVGM